MSPDAFQQRFDVAPDVMRSLRTYADLLTEWQGRMNLVGPATLADIWGRHFADSAQLAALTPRGQHWLDIGSGGGFPGMLLAAMGWGRFTLVDSIAKKCRFLEAVRDALGLESLVTVICGRIETLPGIGADVATARAAAPLATLLDWAVRHLRPGGLALFPKGRRWEEEVADAGRRHAFRLDAVPSITDPDARILLLHGLARH